MSPSCSSSLLSSSSSSRSSSPVPSSPIVNTDCVSFEAVADNVTTVTKRKRVRISESAPAQLNSSSFSTLNYPCLSDQERAESWWSADDFALVKDNLKRQCRLLRQNQRYSDCLTEAYKSACYLADHAEEIDNFKSKSFGAIADEAKAHDNTVAARTTVSPPEGFLRWIKDHGPRGLEGYSSRLHALRRQKHLQEMRQTVLFEQARQRALPANERSAELLAYHAVSVSRRARTFAELLGQADAWAVLHDKSEQSTSS